MTELLTVHVMVEWSFISINGGLSLRLLEGLRHTVLLLLLLLWRSQIVVYRVIDVFLVHIRKLAIQSLQSYTQSWKYKLNFVILLRCQYRNDIDTSNTGHMCK